MCDKEYIVLQLLIMGLTAKKDLHINKLFKGLILIRRVRVTILE